MGPINTETTERESATIDDDYLETVVPPVRALGVFRFSAN